MSDKRIEGEFKPSDKFLLGVVLAVLTFWLFSLSMVSIVPILSKDATLDINPKVLSLGLSLTALFSGCFIVVAGGVADKIGRLKITYLGLGLSVVGSICLVFATGPVIFLAGRILQGLSAACIMSSTLALIKNFYSGAARQRALSFWSIGSWGGGGLYSFFGNIVASEWGWRSIFIISIIVAVIAILLLSGTPESKVKKEGKTSGFDYSGLLFFTVTLISLNFYISNGSVSWTSPLALLSIGLFVVFFIIFFRVEKKKKSAAFIDLSLFKNRSFFGATLSNFLLNASAGALVVTPIFFQTALKFSSQEYSWMTLGYAIAVLAMIRVGEVLLRKLGAKTPMLIGMCITGGGVAIMSLTFLPADIYTVLLAIAFLMYGLGLGFYATPSTDEAISNTPDDKAGAASGIYKMASSLGSSLGNALTLAVYFYAQGTSGDFASIQSATTWSLLLNVGFCAVAIVAVIILVPKKRV